jgi:Fungal chitosanase of glycosyl hydrolase group 75
MATLQEALNALVTLEDYVAPGRQAPPAPAPDAQLEHIITIGYSRIYHYGNSIVFKAGMQIDADGSPRAYNPVSSRGLDDLANAGHPGNWWGIATSNGRANGTPVVQGPSDPAPGFYVSTTALQALGSPDTSQRAYVDASTVPFIVLPSKIGMGLKLGDLCFCLNTATNDNDFGIYADVGPSNQIGEASIAMADALTVPSSPRTGGVAGGILYVVFPGSGSGYQTKDEWFPKAVAALNAWGGLDKAKSLVGEL